ncbi:hypothetical protein [Falsiroseomonas bella]|uniref:hypothetical protein n=1 Tax=Falsiroseomonas bella TaxID=2184016 RepID=UPI001304D721|nr:hypothetical protein [Falsiroseomonas bella]
MEALERQLMGPELLRAFIEVFAAERHHKVAETRLARRERRRALEEVEHRTANLVDAIADGVRAPGVAARLDELEARRAEIATPLDAEPPPAPEPRRSPPSAGRRPAPGSGRQGGARGA